MIAEFSFEQIVAGTDCGTISAHVFQYLVPTKSMFAQCWMFSKLCRCLQLRGGAMFRWFNIRHQGGGEHEEGGCASVAAPAGGSGAWGALQECFIIKLDYSCRLKVSRV
mgnify:CR=1 FL=1